MAGGHPGDLDCVQALARISVAFEVAGQTYTEVVCIQTINTWHVVACRIWLVVTWVLYTAARCVLGCTQV